MSDFTISDTKTQKPLQIHHNAYKAMYKSSIPMLQLLRKKEQQYENVIEKIMTDDLYTALPELIPIN